MFEVIERFKNICGNQDAFCQASNKQANELKSLFGENVSKIIDFYINNQPNNIPMLDSYVQLLGIDRIMKENTKGEPGRFLAKYGVYVIAITVGGNLICIDTNDSKDGDASVVIVDANICSYNKKHDCIEMGIVPRELASELVKNGIVELNYPNLKKCVKKIENSFFEFIDKLSKNEYEDIEEFLE